MINKFSSNLNTAKALTIVYNFERGYPKVSQLRDFKCCVMFSFPYDIALTQADIVLYGEVEPKAIRSELPTYFTLFRCKKSSMICTT